MRQILKAGIALSDHGVASVDENRVARIGRHRVRTGQHDRVRSKVIAGAALMHGRRCRCDCFRALGLRLDFGHDAWGRGHIHGGRGQPRAGLVGGFYPDVAQFRP